MGRDRRRPLTQQELTVLEKIQVFWGPQNTSDEVFFTDGDDAVLFVKDRDGNVPGCVVLTNLGQWYADGTLSRRELRERIMGLAARDGVKRPPGVRSWLTRAWSLASRFWCGGVERRLP
jgi:hypothetical protein